MSRICAFVVVMACTCFGTYAGIAAQDSSQAPRDLKLAPAKPESASRVPRGYALIIGISAYANLDADRQLRYAESDAEAMYRVLISKQGGAFPADNVKLLKGPDATLANIRYYLEEWLPGVAAPDDRVVVYFAGHGFVNAGKGFLAPADVNDRNVWRIPATRWPCWERSCRAASRRNGKSC